MVSVLCIESDAALLHRMKEFLEKSDDFHVDTAQSVSIALQKMKTTFYDAIISDFHMQGVNGVSFFRQIKTAGMTTPLIMFTDRGGEEVVIEAFHTGADSYAKNCTGPESLFIELADKVRYAVSKRRAEEVLRESEEKFRTIFENSPYPISINSMKDGKFIAVNPAFMQSSGYSEYEILGKSPVELKMLSLKDFARLTSHLLYWGKIENVPMVLYGKGGIKIHVLFSTIKVTIQDQPAIMSMTAEITKLKSVEEELLQKNNELSAAYEELAATKSALQAIARSMVGTTGLESLRKITENVSSWLGADCVMVGEIQPDHETVKVLSMILDGTVTYDYSYTLKGTPCENVSHKEFCMYPDNVAQLFPQSKDLVNLNIRGYIGTPLWDSGGDVCGILCVLSREPLKPSQSIREIMEIIAVKAAAEVERMRTPHNLIKDTIQRGFLQG